MVQEPHSGTTQTLPRPQDSIPFPEGTGGIKLGTAVWQSWAGTGEKACHVLPLSPPPVTSIPEPGLNCRQGQSQV